MPRPALTPAARFQATRPPSRHRVLCGIQAGASKGVAECLIISAAGDCSETQYGLMAGWNVSKGYQSGPYIHQRTSLHAWHVLQGDILQRQHLQVGRANADISKFDMSSVYSIDYMFAAATSFNANISKWGVSSVKSMFAMLKKRYPSTQASLSGKCQALTTWCLCSYNATSFNSDMSRWDVSSVTAMDFMFYEATSFNADISNWDVSRVKNVVSAGAGDGSTDNMFRGGMFPPGIWVQSWHANNICSKVRPDRLTMRPLFWQSPTAVRKPQCTVSRQTKSAALLRLRWQSWWSPCSRFLTSWSHPAAFKASVDISHWRTGRLDYMFDSFDMRWVIECNIINECGVWWEYCNYIIHYSTGYTLAYTLQKNLEIQKYWILNKTT